MLTIGNMQIVSMMHNSNVHNCWWRTASCILIMVSQGNAQLINNEIKGVTPEDIIPSSDVRSSWLPRSLVRSLALPSSPTVSPLRARIGFVNNDKDAISFATPTPSGNSHPRSPCCSFMCYNNYMIIVRYCTYIGATKGVPGESTNDKRDILRPWRKSKFPSAAWIWHRCVPSNYASGIWSQAFIVTITNCSSALSSPLRTQGCNRDRMNDVQVTTVTTALETPFLLQSTTSHVICLRHNRVFNTRNVRCVFISYFHS